MQIVINEVNITRFRNFKDQRFFPGKRITLISGQNGVGKSTLLSLIASGSGLSKTGELKNRFQPEFYEYFRIDTEEEYRDYSIYVHYLDLDSNKATEKRLSFKDDSKVNRGIRVIPRTSNSKNCFDNQKVAIANCREFFNSGGSARIPLPTIYLSVSRLQPLGEHSERIKINNLSKTNHVYSKNANEKYSKWYNEVIPNVVDKNGALHLVDKEISTRKSLHMDMLGIPFYSQSVGQDNLGNIISALVDVYLLSLEADYSGAIICIDEIDISLHPDTQLRLLELLDRLSDELKIQFFISSHSLTVVEALLKKQKRDKENYSVVYFKDPSLPRLLSTADFGTLKSDMLNYSSYQRPKIKIYFEDEVGQEIFKLLIQAYKDLFINDGSEEDRKRIEYIRQKKPVSIEGLCHIIDKLDYKIMNIGCQDLLKLPYKDDYFKRVIICLDGDAKSKTVFNVRDYRGNPNIPRISQKQLVSHIDNTIFLPTPFAPESLLYYMIYSVASDPGESVEFWRALDSNPQTELYTSNKIMGMIEIDENNICNDTIKERFGDSIQNSSLWEFIKQSNLVSYFFRDLRYIDSLIYFIEMLNNSFNMCRNFIGVD